MSSNVVVQPIAAAPVTTSTTTTTVFPAAATTTAYPAGAAVAPVGVGAHAHTTSTDKKLIKEQEKMEKQHEKEVAKEHTALEKEEKKREKALLKEQKKREKEEKKMLRTREKEEKKQRKLMQKEEEKRIHEQRTLHETAQKARVAKYRAEEKATTARLVSDVKEFDLAHAHTAPLGLYSEQVDDALPYVPENVGLFIAVARGRNIIDAKEAKADPYVRVLLLTVEKDGKEVVHASHKSEVKSNTANPEWWWHADDTPHLVTENVAWLRKGKLRVEVWDHDKTSSDELLGVIEWPLSALDGKVTRGNFPLQASQLPLATGRTVRKATQPGSIFAEIRYRSPFAFLGMHNKQAMAQQPVGALHQQQPGMLMQHQPVGVLATQPVMTTGVPLASSKTTTIGGPVLVGGVAGAHHEHHLQHGHTGTGLHHTHSGAGVHAHGTHHQPVLATGLPATATTGGVSTVYRAPDVIVPAGAVGSVGAVAPGAISHTHHIHAVELPASTTSTVVGGGVPVMAATHGQPHLHQQHAHAQPHLLGGEQRAGYMLSEQHTHHHATTGVHQQHALPIVAGQSAVGASLPATPAEPHNITHNKVGVAPGGVATGGVPIGGVATSGVHPGVGVAPGVGASALLPGYHPASDPALNPVLTGAKPVEYQTAATGVQLGAPMVGATGAAPVAGAPVAGAPVVGAINLADPPRHVM